MYHYVFVISTCTCARVCMYTWCVKLFIAVSLHAVHSYTHIVVPGVFVQVYAYQRAWHNIALTHGTANIHIHVCNAQYQHIVYIARYICVHVC